MKYIFAVFILCVCLPLAVAGKSMAPWVPTRKKDVERFLKILTLKKGEKFLEIGCGDARISRAVADTFPHSKVMGIELAYPIYFMARLKNIGAPKNLELRLANAFKQDFSNFDVIYVYGMPDKMQEKIIPKFLTQAKKGARLYSYVFSIPEEYRKDAESYGEEGEAKIHVLEKK